MAAPCRGSILHTHCIYLGHPIAGAIIVIHVMRDQCKSTEHDGYVKLDMKAIGLEYQPS
jgi:hypothetical protein